MPEVHGGRQSNGVEELAARLDRHHGPDRNAARVQAVGARGEHAVAHLHVGLERHVLERETVAAGAAHDALAAGALDHRPDAGSAVGDELHLGVRALGQDDAADQAVGGGDRAAREPPAAPA